MGLLFKRFFVNLFYIMSIVVKNESSLSKLIKIKPELVAPLRTGDLVQGKVLNKIAKTLYVDLERYGTGVVFGLEFLNAKSIIKNFKIGDQVNAKVAECENDHGYVELSLTEASKQQSWAEIKDLKEKEEDIAVKITGYNSGGLTTQIAGLVAFLPVSQLSSEHYPKVDDGSKGKIAEELKKFVGAELKVKIIDFNSRNNKLIISEKEVIDDSVKVLLNDYRIGQIVNGVISGIADFGAFARFVDNPKVEGLIHLSELDHKLIDHPKEIVKIDELVKVKIIDIKDGRVSLSLKTLKQDPWDKIEEKYKVSQTVNGVVYKFNPFGALINLENDMQGMIHVSEFGGVEEMKKQLTLNNTYSFIIDSIKLEERRLLLKLAK